MDWYRMGLVVVACVGVLVGACADDDDECKACRDWYADCVADCSDSDEECQAGCGLVESEECSGCQLE